jgi:hypothetical protein
LSDSANREAPRAVPRRVVTAENTDVGLFQGSR